MTPPSPTLLADLAAAIINAGPDPYDQAVAAAEVLNPTEDE